MGKASRRRKDDTSPRRRDRGTQVPFVARPFAGLPNETEWVAMREIVPAATTTVRLAPGAGLDVDAVTVATVLPLAWPGLRRADGTVLVATQTSGSSGDASRDLAAQILATAALDPGMPLLHAPAPTVDTPRLQDLLTDEPIEVTVHEGFDFWVEGQDLDGDGKESLERANASIVPTVRMAAAPSAYWCRIGERTHIRLVLGDDEDAATGALARLYAAGSAGVGEGTRILGAFRAGGLLVPVWDLDPDLDAAAYEDGLAAFLGRYADALAADGEFTAEERRARSGFLSRQVTLR